MKQYTCVKQNGKYMVMEYRKPYIPQTEEEAGEAANEEMRELSLGAPVSYSTLPEDAFSFWSSMEGNIFGEDIFDITIPLMPEDGRQYAIPKQQDMWNKILDEYNVWYEDADIWEMTGIDIFDKVKEIINSNCIVTKRN